MQITGGRQRGTLSVGARLWLINALLATAIVVVIGQAWHTLDMHRASAEHLSALRLAQHYHQRATLSHQDAQTELEHGLRAQALGVPPKAQVLARIRAQAEGLRKLLADIERLPLPEDLRDGHRALQPKAERYVESVRRLVGNGSANGATLKPAPDVAQKFEQLSLAMAMQATRIEKHLRQAEGLAQDEQQRVKQRLAVLGILVILAACTLVLLIARSVRRSLQKVSAVARRIAAGEFGVRAPVPAQDELGELGDAINSMARNLEGMIERLSHQAAEDAFSSQLDDAFGMADSETQARAVVAQAMREIDAALPMELHLADADRQHMAVAARHPLAGAAGCTVGAAARCIAVRRGVTQVFQDSEALNACPHLRGRAAGALSAVCVPMSFMGRSMGVLHAVSTPGCLPDAARIHRLNTLGMQAGTRIGTLRSIRRTQQQADTDALTGLLNRRALEDRVEELRSAGQSFAVIMADIDYFKRLNDSQGHDAGDRALRAFADLLRHAAGERAHAARWGGEEFLLVLPGLDAVHACDVAQSLRADLAAGLPAGVPAFTASFGVSDSAMTPTLGGAVELADGALYRSKEGGRDRVTVATATGAVRGPSNVLPLATSLVDEPGD